MKKMKKCNKIFAFMLLLMIYCSLMCATIRVSPSTFLIQNVPIGEECNISEKYGYKIKISQISFRTLFYMQPSKPSDIGTSVTGFEDIVDENFFYTKPETMQVAPDSMSSAEMYINFPDDKSLYNRHFLLGVDVSEVARQVRGTLAIGAYLILRIETEPNSEAIPVLDSGGVLFVPSVIEFDTLADNDTVYGNVKLFAAESVWCELYRLDPSSVVAEKTILLSVGHARVLEGLVSFPDSVQATPEGTSFQIRVTLSERLPRSRMEEIIIAKTSEDKKIFFRVKLKRIKRSQKR